jgi:hypothetical protein
MIIMIIIIIILILRIIVIHTVDSQHIAVYSRFIPLPLAAQGPNKTLSHEVQLVLQLVAQYTRFVHSSIHSNMYTVDSQYITVDSWYITVDSQYITVDLWYITVDSQYITVDSWYITVDSQYITVDSWYIPPPSAARGPSGTPSLESQAYTAQ